MTELTVADLEGRLGTKVVLNDSINGEIAYEHNTGRLVVWVDRDNLEFVKKGDKLIIDGKKYFVPELSRVNEDAFTAYRRTKR